MDPGSYCYSHMCLSTFRPIGTWLLARISFLVGVLCSACPPAFKKEHESSEILWSRGVIHQGERALISGLDGTDLGVILSSLYRLLHHDDFRKLISNQSPPFFSGGTLPSILLT